MNIPISKPLFDSDELAEVKQVLDSGWVMQGPKVAAFEKAFAEYLGMPWAVAVSSCSTALHLALLAGGIRPGDEVIVPSLTWIATAAAIEECGAKPVFCDVRLDTFNIDTEQVERLINKRTRAIIAVNLFGLAAQLPELRDLAQRKNLILIEDAACSLGATIKGQLSGTFGRLSCFSFHPRKSITTGEGGMIVGHDRNDELKLRSLRSHGAKIDVNASVKKQPFDLGDFDQLGYNYRMTDLQAAVGLAQMKKLNPILKTRQGIAREYDFAFAGLRELYTPAVPHNYGHTYQSYVLLVGDTQGSQESAQLSFDFRDRMMIKLADAGIATRPGTHAVHALGYFKDKYGLREWDLPNAYRAMRQSIALPLYPTMMTEEINFVIEKVKTTYGELVSQEGQPGSAFNKSIKEKALTA